MHRAESILVAIKSQLTGLTTTAGRVYRSFERVAGVPALAVKMGADLKTDQQGVAVVDRELEVNVEITVARNASSDTQFNQIKSEVYAAMMAAPTLGLPYVIRADFLQDDEPGERDIAEPVVKLPMRFSVRYRHSYDSTEG